MKISQKITADKEIGEAEPFFTAPIKLPRLKFSAMKSEEGYLPHIVFDKRSGRWVLRPDKP